MFMCLRIHVFLAKQNYAHPMLVINAPVSSQIHATCPGGTPRWISSQAPLLPDFQFHFINAEPQ